MAILLFILVRRAQRFPSLAALTFALLGLNACAQPPQQAAMSDVGVSAQTSSKSPNEALAAPQAGTLAERTERLKQNVLNHLVFFKGGTFEMGDWGSPEGLPYEAEPDARPQHKVTLDGFSMMAYKVTYEEFDLFTDAMGEQRINQDPDWSKYRAPRKPAGVNWHGAKAYCQWLGKLTGQPFDLATEAQWEYAARSRGKRLLFATDNGSIDEGRNYPKDGELDRTLKIRLVSPDIGTYPPNPAGLFGMLDYGSREWVNDWYDPNYYKVSPKNNPRGPEQGSVVMQGDNGAMERVQRGLRGSSPAFGGFVFSRGSNIPKTFQVWLKGKENEPLPGFSSSADNQFRCVVNAPKPLR